jgi:Skp family chaperone for outer membrane proteins
VLTVAIFDTLKLARRLQTAGMPADQASGLAEALSETMTTELATKSDLKELRSWAMAELAALRGEMQAEFAKLREEMRTGQAALREEMRTGQAALREEMRTGQAALREEMRTGQAQLRLEIAQSKNETVRWMIGLFIAQMTVTLGAILRLVG